jgi:hypothetical protein
MPRLHAGRATHHGDRRSKALQAAGSVRYSRGLIEILDRRALQRGACECYASVLEKHAQLLGVRPFSASDPFNSAHIDFSKISVAGAEI